MWCYGDEGSCFVVWWRSLVVIDGDEEKEGRRGREREWVR